MDLRDRLARLFHESGAASLVVAVARDGEVVFEEGFGWADRAQRVVATPHVPYSLASITKPITATALLHLVEAGSVELDGPGALSNGLVLMHRGMSIAGGTSEIKRNQIGERILGLPRDPLLN